MSEPLAETIKRATPGTIQDQEYNPKVSDERFYELATQEFDSEGQNLFIENREES